MSEQVFQGLAGADDLNYEFLRHRLETTPEAPTPLPDTVPADPRDGWHPDFATRDPNDAPSTEKKDD